MPLDVEINPGGVEDKYLSGLNRSFGQWGDRHAFRWDFEREVGARPADLMVLRDHGQILAGSAVSYRTVCLGDDRILIGIMTGSWTLPEARGRGAFSQVIVESQRLVASRGGSVLIAFVTHENASRRRLVAAGCLEIPTWYVASNQETMAPVDAPVVETSTATVAQLFRARKRWQGHGSGAYVLYPSVEVWASQYLDRPLPVERLTAAGCHCLIEHAPVSDRILWIDGGDRSAALAALLARAVGTGRQLFLFTMDAGLVQAGIELGMVAKPGSITVLDPLDQRAGPSGLASLPTAWRLQGGDRA
jgi:hypothetical protein